MREKSIVGDAINFRGLVYAPMNENGVVFLFGKVVDELNMHIEEIKPGFPDCIGRRFTGKGWERVRIEFEFQSSNFALHGHNPDDCDIVVCWEHDWKACPLEVIELKSEIESMENYPIKRPKSTAGPKPEGIQALKELFSAGRISAHVQDWFGQIDSSLREWNPEIWTNVGTKYIGIYSPEKAFASLKPQAASLQIECFGRGQTILGTKVVNRRFSPRWVVFTVKRSGDVPEAIAILKEAHTRLKAAMKEGEPTSYFSGGEKPGIPPTHEESNLR